MEGWEDAESESAKSEMDGLGDGVGYGEESRWDSEGFAVCNGNASSGSGGSEYSRYGVESWTMQMQSGRDQSPDEKPGRFRRWQQILFIGPLPLPHPPRLLH